MRIKLTVNGRQFDRHVPADMMLLIAGTAAEVAREIGADLLFIRVAQLPAHGEDGRG